MKWTQTKFTDVTFQISTVGHPGGPSVFGKCLSRCVRCEGDLRDMFLSREEGNLYVDSNISELSVHPLPGPSVAADW